MSEADDRRPEKTPIEQAVDHALDLFVYAPIGVLFEGASLLPDLIAKGKGHVATARVMGHFAVQAAQQSAESAATKLQDQAAGVIDFVSSSVTPLTSEPPTEPPTEPAPSPSTRVTSAAAKASKAATTAASNAVAAAKLAIPDYDGLSASQVVNRLAGLSPIELENVQLYEAAHRGRKTILSKVAQLQGR